MANVNVRLSGIAEKILGELVKQGYAASKTEAIRLALIDYNEHHPILEALEDEQDLELVLAFENKVKEGKARLHGEKELKRLFG